jgi:hypothetical protein
MIQVNYELFPPEMLANYYKFLINQLYKCLCLKEDGCETLESFLQSMNYELIGSKSLIVSLKGDARFISLLNKIQFLISEPDLDLKIFKKEIFSCIKIVEKLEDQHLKKVGDNT